MQLAPSEYKPKQPEKCKDCIWGKWDGTIQYCPKIICVEIIEAIHEKAHKTAN